jgi:ATP/maltotriose-dependent transcriptional regulator MalT
MEPSRLVGRRSELASLERALEALAAGAPAAIAILGEPGIGKSRLLAELASGADARGLLVLDARADELERDLPLGAFVDALDDYLAALEPRWLSQLGDATLAELRAAFPSLATSPEAANAEPDRRQRLHRAIRSLLARLAQRRPLVLVLDDVHWADPASIDLVAQLLRRPPGAPVLLALAARPRSAPPRLAAALRGAAADGTVEVLELAPLGDEDLAELVSRPLDAATRTQLLSDSGGNPFYLEQLLRAHTEARRAGDAAAASTQEGVPPAVAAAIAAELDALAARVRTVLEAAAVVGEQFEPDVVAEAAGVEEGRVLVALDALLAADLVRTTDVPRRFRFRHPIVRRAVYDTARPAWRLAAHARVAAALEQRGLPATARAAHVERSAHAGDERAVALLAEAARASAPRAPASAARWFGAALRLLPGGPPERRLELLVPQAQSLAAAGRLEEAASTLQDVLGLLPPGLVRERARVVATCAKLEHLLGRHGAGRALLEGALAGLPDGASPEAAALKVQLTSDCFFSGDFDGMRRWADDALATARALGDPVLCASATGLTAGALYMTTDIAAAHARLDEAAALVDALPDADLAPHVSTLGWFGWIEVFLERFDDALRHLGRGIAVARTAGQGQLLVVAGVGEANALLCTGRLAEAAERADAAAEIAELQAPGPLLAWALALGCWAALLQGDLAAAERHGDRALDEVAHSGDVVSILAGCFRAEVRLEAGEHEAAREQLLAAAGGPDLPLIERAFQPRWYEVLTRAELGLGRPADAASWARRATGAAEGVPLGGPTAAARRAEALVALEEGAPERAASLALAGAVAAEGAGMPIEGARSRGLAGASLAAAGDRARAIEELTAAEATLATCGAARLRDDARRVLRGLGRRRPAAPVRATSLDPLSGLSPRELEVAALIADGATNRQIAERLVVSERTVESHVAHIFDKLGVRSRAAVASAVAGARRGAA